VVRVIMFAVAAFAWPLWWPLLRAVVAEVRAADKSTPEPPVRPPRPRREKLVNTGWDDAHVRPAGGSRRTLARGARRAAD